MQKSVHRLAEFFGQINHAIEQSLFTDQFDGFEQRERDIAQQEPIHRKVDIGLQTGRINQANRQIFLSLQS